MTDGDTGFGNAVNTYYAVKLFEEAGAAGGVGCGRPEHHLAVLELQEFDELFRVLLLLALGAAFTIANVVRLTILLHRDEIEILRLVGAPEFLIRGPFLLGGVLQGLLGGLAALGLLALAFRALLLFISATENVLLGVFVVRFLSPATCGLLVLGGVLAGLLGGTVASRRRHV